MSITNERNYGIDLLRMIAMFMVVILHVLGQGGILNTVSSLSLNYEIAWFLEISAYCAVNCYALISGYVGINSKFKFTNIIILWLQVVFYTLGITIIFAVLNPGTVGIKEIIKAIFPVMTGQYWYFTAYFCLFFFIPIFNEAINNLTKSKLKYLLIGMILIFSILPTIFRRDIFGTSGGYSGLWLMVLYILGAYIKKYGFMKKCSAKLLAVLYAVCILFTWGAKYILEYFTLTYLGEMKGGGLLVSYTSPTILLSAIALLILFSKIHFGNNVKKIISIFSPVAFGVYLIHDQPLFCQYIMANRFIKYASLSGVVLFFAVLFTAFGIYFVCSLIDMIRNKIFKILKIKQKVLSIENKIIKL